MSAVLAATHPERIVGLVLIGGFARLAAGEGYDWGADPAIWLSPFGRVSRIGERHGIRQLRWCHRGWRTIRNGSVRGPA